MKKKESTDLEVKVVDCSKLEERDLNKVLGKIFEEAYWICRRWQYHVAETICSYHLKHREKLIIQGKTRRNCYDRHYY